MLRMYFAAVDNQDYDGLLDAYGKDSWLSLVCEPSTKVYKGPAAAYHDKLMQQKNHNIRIREIRKKPYVCAAAMAAGGRRHRVCLSCARNTCVRGVGLDCCARTRSPDKCHGIRGCDPGVVLRHRFLSLRSGAVASKFAGSAGVHGSAPPQPQMKAPPPLSLSNQKVFQ